MADATGITLPRASVPNTVCSSGPRFCAIKLFPDGTHEFCNGSPVYALDTRNFLMGKPEEIVHSKSPTRWKSYFAQQEELDQKNTWYSLLCRELDLNAPAMDSMREVEEPEQDEPQPPRREKGDWVR